MKFISSTMMDSDAVFVYCFVGGVLIHTDNSLSSAKSERKANSNQGDCFRRVLFWFPRRGAHAEAIGSPTHCYNSERKTRKDTVSGYKRGQWHAFLQSSCFKFQHLPWKPAITLIEDNEENIVIFPGVAYFTRNKFGSVDVFMPQSDNL